MQQKVIEQLGSLSRMTGERNRRVNKLNRKHMFSISNEYGQI